MFRDPVIQFNGVYFDQNLYPDSPDVRGKMHLLWGDIPSNLCPEQCSTEADYYTEAHPCEPSLCNFYTNNEEGQIESQIPSKATMPFDGTKQMGDSIASFEEKRFE